MKIYTRTGDEGETGLFAGPRVSKAHVRIEAYGDVDELNSVLGIVRCQGLSADIDQLLNTVQHDLFALGAELATPQPAQHGLNLIGLDQITVLEQAIDRSEADLTPLQQFILPGGTPAAAMLHLARTVCRRAERNVVRLAQEASEPISAAVIQYLNRLGDLLFVLARLANHRSGRADTPWQKPKDGV